MKAIFVILTLFTSIVFAQDDLVTVKYDGVSSTATSPSEAVKAISSEATETIARNQVFELIGEAKYKKFKEKIDKRIIAQSSKFIPYIHPGQAVGVPGGGFKVSVELKVSQDSLRKLVENAGLLADTESPGSFISLVSFTNKSNNLTYKWWAPEALENKKDLVALSSLWQQTIASELEKKHFQIAKPKIQSVDEKELAASALAQMIIRGEGRVHRADDGSGSLAMKVGVFQASDSRLVADITRSAKFAHLSETTLRMTASQLFSEISKELALTVHDAWKSGIIGSSAVHIAAIGTLSPKQLDDFKTELGRTVHDLKNIRERKFSSGRVILEADYKGSLTSLSDRLKQAQLPSFQTEVDGVQNSEVEVRVKARR